MSKNKTKARVKFIGKNANDVTGSCTLIEMQDYKILLECGLYQSNNIREDYKINNRRLEFKPSEIDYIFINHAHIDHIGLLPRLYANGCKARIIAPRGTSSIFAIMGMDSAHIMAKDVETLNRRYHMDVDPVYTADDVTECLKYFDEYDFEEEVRLNESICFRFIPSGHIICSAQLELWLSEKNHTSKILYTSDLGNISIPKYYTNKFQPVEKANLVIAESTYSNSARSATLANREKDLEKIKSVIQTVCVDNKNKVLIPVFSLDRAQNILTCLYDLFGRDDNFDIPILIDSPLTIQLSMLYSTLLEGEALEKYEEVMNWENIKFVSDYNESLSWQGRNEPMCVLAASGFMQAGRSRLWAKTLLPNPRNHILFVGYSSPESLAGKIKNYKGQKTIVIDGKPVANKCGITSLISFTSHIQHDDMVKYYSEINCEKICLVHGDFKDKCKFGQELQEEISKKNHTSKVVIVNAATEILI